MSEITPAQMNAITQLMGAVSIQAPPLNDVLRRSARLSESSNVKPPGFYKVGGKKYMSGGGICEDNWVVRMAVNSAIVLGGTAAATGVGYTGYTYLSTFMRAFRLDKAIQDSIKAIYAIVSASGSLAYQVGSSIVDIGSATTGALGTIAPPVGRAIGSMTTPIVMTSPFIAIGRYYRNENDAMTDLQNIVNNITQQQSALSERTGAITRSIAEKKKQLSDQLGEVKDKITEYKETSAASAAAGRDATVGGFSTMQSNICSAIDNVLLRGANAVDAIDAALNPFYDFKIDDVNFDLRGGKGRRTRKSKNAKKGKKAKKTKKSKKAKKTKKRKTKKH